MRRLAAELIGTFMLVAAVLGAAVVSGNAAGLGVAFAIGLSVMAMIYAVGPISGGHFNPAVTVGLWAAGRFEPARIIPYVLAQLAGGILAALFFYVVLSGKADFTVGGYASTGYGEHSAGGFSLLGALLSEIVFTAIFVLIIARVTRPEEGAGLMAPVAHRAHAHRHAPHQHSDLEHFAQSGSLNGDRAIRPRLGLGTAMAVLGRAPGRGSHRRAPGQVFRRTSINLPKRTKFGGGPLGPPFFFVTLAIFIKPVTLS